MRKDTILEHNKSIKEIAINVKRFGAKGDGVTDDSQAIQNAINSMNGTGGTVFFPSGTYLCKNKAINFNVSNITYSGTENTTLLSTYGILPFLISGENITFNAICFKNQNTSSQGVTLHFEQNTKHIKIENCKFIGQFGRINISNTGIEDINIVSNYFEESGYGILVNENSSDLRKLSITNNHFKNMIGEGIELNTPNIRGVGAKQIVISNNIYEKDLDYMIDKGLELKGWHGLLGSSGASDLVVSDNTIDGFYLCGIDVEDECDHIVITGNKIKNCYGGGRNYKAGFYVEKGDFINANNKIYIATNNGIAGVIPNVNRWKHNTQYNVGDYVWIDDNDSGYGEIFKCITAGTSGSIYPYGRKQSISDGTCVWNWVDKNWQLNTSYAVGDIKISNDRVYICKASGISSNTTQLSGTTSSILDGSCVWDYINTTPTHTTGIVSDKGVNWKYVVQSASSFLSNGYGIGINVQDGSYINITGNICDKAGDFGILLDGVSGYDGSDDNLSNVYTSVISSNICTRNANGINIKTDGKKSINVSGNIVENNDKGINIKTSKTGLSLSSNLISSNVVGLYIQSIFADNCLYGNNFSKNTTPIKFETGQFCGGLKLSEMNECKINWTLGGANTGLIPMFSLGNYAKGTITLKTYSNINDYVVQMYDVSWDGTTLTQNKVYQLYNGSVGGGMISMSGKDICCQIMNGNSNADYVYLSLSFDGVVYLRS